MITRKFIIRICIVNSYGLLNLQILPSIEHESERIKCDTQFWEFYLRTLNFY